MSREDEALHSSVSSRDAKQTRIYVFLKLPETKDAVVERYVEAFLLFLMHFRDTVAALNDVDSLTSESLPSCFCTVVFILKELKPGSCTCAR